MTSSLENEICQPIAAFHGNKAKLRSGSSASEFIKLNFKNSHGLFFYDIKISKFVSNVFLAEANEHFAYLIQVFVKTDNYFETPFSDTHIFFEKDFEDFVEYSIILPRLFKRHHRYVLDLEGDKVCTFKEFGEKIKLWKKKNGLF
tara:strand:- start:609 stop:1043 length:435 start_codon:yes stop_codon:yes gene_type:complete